MGGEAVATNDSIWELGADACGHGPVISHFTPAAGRPRQVPWFLSARVARDRVDSAERRKLLELLPFQLQGCEGMRTSD